MPLPLSREQDAKVEQWLRETVYPAVISQQRARYTPRLLDRILCREIKYPTAAERDSWEAGYPYNGALTYEITPTSIGPVERVSYTGYPAKLDVTDYDLW